MAFVKSKGTSLKQYLGSLYVSVAQVVSLKKSPMKSETYEADTLDNANAGIPKKPTMRTDAGDVSGELFFDPALSGHKSLLALLTTPAMQLWQIVFADTASTTWPFSGGGFSMGTTVDLKSGLKADFTIELDGLPTFPA